VRKDAYGANFRLLSVLGRPSPVCQGLAFSLLPSSLAESAFSSSAHASFLFSPRDSLLVGGTFVRFGPELVDDRQECRFALLRSVSERLVRSVAGRNDTIIQHIPTLIDGPGLASRFVPRFEPTTLGRRTILSTHPSASEFLSRPFRRYQASDLKENELEEEHDRHQEHQPARYQSRHASRTPSAPPTILQPRRHTALILLVIERRKQRKFQQFPTDLTQIPPSPWSRPPPAKRKREGPSAPNFAHGYGLRTSSHA